MTLLNPVALWALALALPLVLFYFVRARRREQRVASLLLWEQEPRERSRSPFLRRLQRDPLLILQLLVLAALAVALARPSVTLLGEGERKLVVILDTSASMKARDVSPNRFEVSRAKALTLLDSLREGTHAMVIEAGTQPRVSSEMSPDLARARRAVRAAAVRDLPNRLGEAIRTARGLTGSDSRAEIHVFTDGAFAPLAEFSDNRIRWIGTGRSDRNVGITNLAVRKTFQGTSGYEALLSLANFSAQPRSFAFTLNVDERTVVEREITLEGHLHRTLILPFRHSGPARISARLRVEDDFSPDDVAYAVLPPPRKVAITLVSEGNAFLEKALRADPSVALQLASPAQYAGGMGSADIVVLDSVTPSAIGAGRFILVNTVPPDLPVELLGSTDRPGIVDWDREHPIMRHVDFSNVAIETGLRIRPLAPGRALVESEQGRPLIYALEENQRKSILIGFDLLKADLPLRVAFPLILSNALRWLNPAGYDHASLQWAAGEPALIPLPQGVQSAVVTTPGGRTVSGRVVRGMLSLADTAEIGLYSLATERGDARAAVNLMNDEESNIAPRELPTGAAPTAAVTVPIEREVWGLLVMLALVLLLLEALLYVRRQAGGRFRIPRDSSDRGSLAVRSVLVVALCAIAFRPALPRLLDRMNVVFVLDHSASIGAAARAGANTFIDRAVYSAKPGDRHAVVVFGTNAVLDQPLAERPEFERPKAEIDARGSNIFQALQLALAALPAGEANRIVLLSDGRQNEGNALAAAQAARASGADLHYVPEPMSPGEEVVAESLALPREVKFGEPFYARVVAWSNKDTQGRLSLFRNGEFVGSQQVKLTAGKNVLSYRQALDSEGLQVYQASLEVAGDTIQENNRAVGTVVVRGRPQVLLADKEKEHAQALAAALRSQRLDVSLVDPGGIPASAAALQKYDGLILSNVSSMHLHGQQMAQIRDYVRDHGGGLLMVGGDQSFGLGGYYQTPIEEALPVTMDVKQKVDVPNLAIILSIDRSDSMTTIASGKVTYLDLAKEAAHLVVDLLDENSEVGVMSWDTQVKWEVPLRLARNKDQIHRGISSIVSGGGTDGYPAMREAHATLSGRPALLKHVIFLTDGQMRRDQFQELVERMAREQITVSGVAVGKFADERLVIDIARWGRGRFYRTEDSQTLPRIFAVETQLASNATVIEQPFRPTLTDPIHEAVQNINWKAVPPLGGYVATTPKAAADQVLTSHWEDPVLATWRYGLGRTAAFTSDVNPRWSQQWLHWREFSKFWAQLVRWTLRSASTGGTTAGVERKNGFGEVTVESVDTKGNFVNFLDAQIGVVAPDRSRSVIDLEQVAPGRYRARFPAPQEGVYLVGLNRSRSGSDQASQVMGLVVPYDQELRDIGIDETTLKEIAEITGGGAMSNPEEVFLKARRPFSVSVEIWPWLVALGALLLIIDVAIRRFGTGSLQRTSPAESAREAASSS